jgi:hypothetical protein
MSRRRRGEQPRDPPARLGRVDHVVDLEPFRDAERLAVLVQPADDLVMG